LAGILGLAAPPVNVDGSDGAVIGRGASIGTGVILPPGAVVADAATIAGTRE
jgi:UDP-3-O-[3-hydroxymyristoyl] glucosamine N-acyltransferase